MGNRKEWTLAEKKHLEELRNSDLDDFQIGEKIGRIPASVKQEYYKNGGRQVYTAALSEERKTIGLEIRKKSNSFKTEISGRPVTLYDRKVIEKYKNSKLSASEIGEKIGRHKSVIIKEFTKSGGRHLYDSKIIQEQEDLLKENRYSLLRVDNVIQEKDKALKEMEKNIILEFSNDLSKENFLITSKTILPDYIPRLPLKIWVDRYKEEFSGKRKHWKKELKYFEFWLLNIGDCIAVDIDSHIIESCADKLLTIFTRNKRYMSHSTRAKYLLYLSSLYTTAIKEWKWAIFNPLSCVNMSRHIKKEHIETDKTKFEKFVNIKTTVCDIVNNQIKETRLSIKEAAQKCGLSLHSFQFLINPENNITLFNFLKVCEGFGIEVTVKRKEI